MMREAWVGSSKKKLRRAILSSRLIWAKVLGEQTARATQARARRRKEGRAFIVRDWGEDRRGFNRKGLGTRGHASGGLGASWMGEVQFSVGSLTAVGSGVLGGGAGRSGFVGCWGALSREASVTAGSPGPQAFSFLSKRSCTFHRVSFSPDRLTKVPGRRTSAESSRRERTMAGSNGSKLTRADPRTVSRVIPRARQ